MRLSPLIIMVSFIGACTDHGLKIHEDPPTATILEPGDGGRGANLALKALKP